MPGRVFGQVVPFICCVGVAYGALVRFDFGLGLLCLRRLRMVLLQLVPL